MSVIKGCVIENGVLVKYKGSAKKVVIPKCVTEIGSAAFRNNYHLEEVVIPEGVTRIGHESFYECGYLTKVELPNTLTEIKSRAFGQCSRLTEFVIPDSVTSIGAAAFLNCRKLEPVTIPDSVTNLGCAIFSGCRKQADKNGFTIIRGTLDSYAGIDTTVVIPQGVTAIGELVFNGLMDLEHVVIPEGVTSIGDMAFYRCFKLTEVVIPEGVTSIGSSAFELCRNLDNVTLPDTVTSIGANAFKDCKKLADENGFIIFNGILSDYCGSGGKVQIPEGVTTIGNKAFRGCGNITDIVIPQGVTKISNEAFAWCWSIASIDIPESVNYIGLDAFAKIPESAKIIAPYIPVDDFLDTEEKYSATYGFLYHPERYTQPDCLEYYQKYVIARKKKLLGVIFKDDLVAGLAVFGEKGKITSDNFETEFMKPAQEANAERCIAYLRKLQEKGLQEKPAAKQPKKQQVKDPYNPVDMKKLWSYETMADGTLKITSYKGTETEVVVPERIGKTAVTRVDDYAFATITKAEMHRPGSRMSALESIVSIRIPDSIKSIGERAFYGCKNLTGLVIPESVEQIGKGAFWGCAKLADENGFVIIRDVVYFYCGAGGRAEIPEGVQRISELTFRSDLMPRECKTLTGIVIPKSVKSMDKNVFPLLSDHAQIVAPTISFYEFETPNEKRAAALGYLCKPDLYAQNSSLEGYQKYVVSQRTKLLDVIFAQDMASALNVYEAKGKITAANFELDYRKPAKEANAVSCMAWLLEWERKNAAKNEEKQGDLELSLDPYSPAELKKLWTYEHREDGTWKITGYKGTETQVVVPECIGKTPVTLLDDYTFATITKSGNNKPKIRVAALESITSVHIPDSVDIGSFVFHGCKGLADQKGLVIVRGTVEGYYGTGKKVVIPDGVTCIAQEAFLGCNTLQSVVIPGSVKRIEDKAFCYCSQLKEVVLSEGLEYIGKETFNKCESLKKIALPKGLKQLGEGVFNACCKLEKASLPEGVTELGKNLFLSCWELREVVIPKSVTRIGERAFFSCQKLTSVELPEGVKRIENSAFFGCTGLTSMILPKGLQYIGEHAFVFCENLTEIVIPGTVVSIEKMAFDQCTHLATVIFQEGIKTIGKEAFMQVTGLTTVVIPDSVTTIGEAAFGKCERLTNVTIGNGVEEISENAFRECKNLQSITIPDSVVAIGAHSFRDCSNLQSITLGNGVSAIPLAAFLDCKKLTSITIPDSVAVIGDSAFGRCEELSSVTIGKGVTAIEKNAFRFCKSLHAVTIPESVTTIGDHAFRDCPDLTMSSKAGSYAQSYAQKNGIPFVEE